MHDQTCLHTPPPSCHLQWTYVLYCASLSVAAALDCMCLFFPGGPLLSSQCRVRWPVPKPQGLHVITVSILWRICTACGRSSRITYTRAVAYLSAVVCAVNCGATVHRGAESGVVSCGLCSLDACTGSMWGERGC